MTSPETQRAAADAVSLDEVERAVQDIRAGRAVVVVDDATRENEGDIIFAASKATPELLAFTIRPLADSATDPRDIVRPGHVFPLRYTEGGVLRRRGHTEAAVDLARLAGLRPAGVVTEIVNEDGTMARLSRLREFADEHGLQLISIEQL